MKKIVLVNSDITYIPDNYFSVLEKIILENKDKEIVIILTKINKLKLIKNIFLLFLAGASGLAYILFKNIFSNKEQKLKNMGVVVFKINSVNDENFLDFLKRERFDLIFNLRSRQIFKETILNNNLILNLHHGILPKNRGVFSDMRNLANDRDLGLSIHKINKSIDEGDVLVVKKIEYKKNKIYQEYLKFSTEVEAVFISEWISSLEKNLKKKIRIRNEKKFIFYKNPTWTEIREMKKKGLML